MKRGITNKRRRQTLTVHGANLTRTVQWPIEVREGEAASDVEEATLPVWGGGNGVGAGPSLRRRGDKSSQEKRAVVVTESNVEVEAPRQTSRGNGTKRR